MDLAGGVAFVTGGSGGVGAAVSEAVASAGADEPAGHVLLVSAREDGVEEITSAVRFADPGPYEGGHEVEAGISRGQGTRAVHYQYGGIRGPLVGVEETQKGEVQRLTGHQIHNGVDMTLGVLELPPPVVNFGKREARPVAERVQRESRSRRPGKTPEKGRDADTSSAATLAGSLQPERSGGLDRPIPVLAEHVRKVR